MPGLVEDTRRVAHTEGAVLGAVAGDTHRTKEKATDRGGGGSDRSRYNNR